MVYCVYCPITGACKSMQIFGGIRHTDFVSLTFCYGLSYLLLLFLSLVQLVMQHLFLLLYLSVRAIKKATP